MKLTFLMGPAGSGKTRSCLEGMRQALAGGPKGPAAILVVPEQATFQTEFELAALGGPSPRGHVLSFQRLAVRVFGEVGGAARPRLDERGRKMVLRALLEQHKSELRLFSQLADKAGFLDLLGAALGEFRAHGQGPDELVATHRKLAEEAPSQTLLDKLHDLAIVMRALEGHLEGRFTDPDLTLSLLAARIGQASLIRGAEIWVDGFFGFTPEEYRVLRALVEHAQEVRVTLCLDDREGLFDYPDNALFRPTLDTYVQLQEMAVKHGFAVEEVRLWGPSAQAFFFEPSPAVTLVRAPDRRTEVEALAAEILRLCREQGYRFRDVAVVTRDLEAYHDLVEAVFEGLDIPHFVDRRRSVAHHPVVELVRSALEAIGRNWVTDAVLRYLKTDLVPVSRDEIDRLENLVIEHGIKGRRWVEGAWEFHRRALDEASDPGPARPAAASDPRIEEIRRRATGALARLDERMARAASVREACEAVFGLLEDLDVPGRLAAWLEASPTGSRASEHEQVYAGLLDLLDQTVAALGDQRVSNRAFAAILEAGLSDLQLGLVPPTRDQVLFGTIERSRHPAIRAMFIVGAQLGSFPRSIPEDPFLDDAERLELGGRGFEIGPESRTLLYHERYLLYIAQTRATERLIVSYPLADGQGRGLLPGGLFKQLEGQPGTFLRDLSVSPLGTDAVNSVAQLLEAIALNLRAGVAQPWEALYAWAQDNLPDAIRPVKAGLAGRSADGPLEPGLSEAVLLRSAGPGRFVASISRLEAFGACPFLHFARHGLRLEPRRRHSIEPSEVGVLAHAALRQYVAASRDLPLACDDERAELIRAISARLAQNLKGAILLESGRSRHVLEQITRTLEEAASVLSEHDRRGRFAAAGLEVSFGARGELPALVVPLDDGAELALEGQIDRIDVAERAGLRFVRVIDYKLSSRSFSVGEAALGLTLQLPIYLAVSRRYGHQLAASGALEGQQGLDVAAMLYFPVQGKWTSVPLDEDEARRKIVESHKARGLVSADAAVARLLDDTGAQGYSEILELYWKKDGELSEGNSKIATASQFETLERHALGVARQYANRIRAGEVDPSPYRIGHGRTPCTTCDYRAVCRFDPASGDRPRQLTVPPRDEAWDIMAR